MPAALDGERIDRVVAMVTGLPRSAVTALVESGAVRIGGRPATSRSRKLHAGEVIEVDVPEPAGPALVHADPTVPFEVVHADDAVIVVDKPAGIVVHPGSGQSSGTLVHGLLDRFPDLAHADWADPSRPGIVHRLDKGTSGLLVVARTTSSHRALVRQLQARTVQRMYVALVQGRLDGPAGVIDAPVGRSTRDRTRMAVASGGREARTRYEVVAHVGADTLIECHLETGRTHQIRVHLAAIGHPVVGDERYGRRAGLGRPFLHAARLAFDHPTSGERVAFESPLPAELAELLA